MNKYWCNENFGICYPLLKEVDISKPISEQKNYNNEYARYWIKPVLVINGKHYILCSQWYREFQNKFDEWIEKSNNERSKTDSEVYVAQKIHTESRKKENCNFYDSKKDECMCTKSVMFTQPCNNIGNCPYYSDFKIYVVPKEYNKKKICPYCNEKTEKEFVVCDYAPDGYKAQKKLITYRCEKCKRNYISDVLYRNFVKSKSLDDLNVSFEVAKN